MRIIVPKTVIVPVVVLGLALCAQGKQIAQKKQPTASKPSRAVSKAKPTNVKKKVTPTKPTPEAVQTTYLRTASTALTDLNVSLQKLDEVMADLDATMSQHPSSRDYSWELGRLRMTNGKRNVTQEGLLSHHQSAYN